MKDQVTIRSQGEDAWLTGDTARFYCGVFSAGLAGAEEGNP